MTREDTTSRTEAAASDAARILGASEAIGGGVGDQEANPLLAKALGPDPWGDPPPTPREWPPIPTDPPF